MNSSEKSIKFSFEIIETNSFHRKPAHDNVKKKVGIPNSLTTTKTSCGNLLTQLFLMQY